MKPSNFTRRKFIISTSTGAVEVLLSSGISVSGISSKGAASDLAINGGKPFRADGWMKWPVWNSNTEKRLENAFYLNSKLKNI